VSKAGNREQGRRGPGGFLLLAISFQLSACPVLGGAWLLAGMDVFLSNNKGRGDLGTGAAGWGAWSSVRHLWLVASGRAEVLGIPGLKIQTGDTWPSAGRTHLGGFPPMRDEAAHGWGTGHLWLVESGRAGVRGIPCLKIQTWGTRLYGMVRPGPPAGRTHLGGFPPMRDEAAHGWGTGHLGLVESGRAEVRGIPCLKIQTWGTRLSILRRRLHEAAAD